MYSRKRHERNAAVEVASVLKGGAADRGPDPQRRASRRRQSPINSWPEAAARRERFNGIAGLFLARESGVDRTAASVRLLRQGAICAACAGT